MKRLGIVFVSLLSVFVFAVNASAQGDTSGLYVGLLGGFSFPPALSTTLTDQSDGENDKGDINMKTGWLAGAKVGYLTPFTGRIIAAELEYNHLESNYDNTKQYAGGTIDGGMKADVLMVNLIGRYPGGRWHPYVGVGGGYANVKVNDISGWAQNAKIMTIQGGSQGVFAYQFLAGVDFDITRNWMVGLGYKYLASSSMSFNTTASAADGSASIPVNVDTTYKSHNLVLTVGYNF